MAANIGQLLAIQELKNRGVGIAENIASVGSSWAVEPFAGLTGLVALPLGHERATQAINNMREKFTYQPRSKEGKEAQEFIADKSKYLSYPAAGYLGMAELATGQGLDRATQTISQAKEEGVESAIGDRAYEITGSPLAASVSSAAPAAVASYFGFKGVPKIGKQYQFGDIKSGGNKQRGTFGGVKAKNANLEMQAAAEELANRGIPPEEIWAKTGWFKGQDGKWRFEIDDSGFEPKMYNYETDTHWRQTAQDRPIPLALAYELGDLGKSYPEMKREVKVSATHPDVYGGAFEPDKNILSVPSDDLLMGLDEAQFKRYDSEGLDRSVPLHELQHSIQETEGFAKGGSPDDFFQQETAKQAQQARAWAKEVRKKREEMPNADWHIVEQRIMDEYRKENLPEFIPTREVRDLANQPYFRYPENYPKQSKDVNDLIKMYGLDARTTPRKSMELYQRLYGEAEARLVQERMNMTEAERKAYPPMKHMEDMLAKEGIKMDELIVRSDSGKSMSIEQQMAREELKRRGIIAYHGTPHEVDKFSSQYIGTGEGAQAYGHGLYFAESPDVAKGYQSRIAGADWVDKQGNKVLPNDVAQKIIDEGKAQGLGVVERERLASGWSEFVDKPESAHPVVKKVLDDTGVNLNQKGNLYKVELDIDPDTEMLDWDKPLSDETAKQWVKEAAQSMPTKEGGEFFRESLSKNIDQYSNINGRVLYETLSMFLDKKDLNDYLQAKGIKGIKYRDQMSRGAEGGTSNFVVFDDNLIRIAEKNGVKFEQVEKLAKEKNISKQQALSMLIGGSVGAALWNSGESKPDRS